MFCWCGSIHAAHAACIGCGSCCGVGCGIGLVGHDGLSRQDAGADGRCVLKRGTGDLRRIDDTGGDHVAVGGAVGIVAEADLAAVLDLLEDDGAVDTGVLGDLADRSLQRLDDDGRAGPRNGCRTRQGAVRSEAAAVYG